MDPRVRVVATVELPRPNGLAVIQPSGVDYSHLRANETRQAVSTIIDAEIEDDLVRRISDLDNKLRVTSLIITCVNPLDSYLDELQP